MDTLAEAEELFHSISGFNYEEVEINEDDLDPADGTTAVSSKAGGKRAKKAPKGKKKGGRKEGKGKGQGQGEGEGLHPQCKIGAAGDIG